MHVREGKRTLERMSDPLNTGVYVIRNTVNGKRYVGSAAVSFNRRWQQHRSTLNTGTHKNVLLQRAWKKYGENCFEFEVAEYCCPEACVGREQHWIDYYGSTKRGVGYNIYPTAGSPLGRKLSEASKAKISASHKGRVHSPESRARMGAASRGRMHSAESKSRMSEAQRAAYASGRRQPTKLSKEARLRIAACNTALHTGRKRSPETCAKISAAKMGKRPSEETRARLAAAMTGKKHTEESKLKIGAAGRGRKYSAEHRAKMSMAQKGKRHTEETRAKLSAIHSGRKLSEETKAKIGAFHRGRKRSAETRAKLSAALTGIKRSAETRAKMSTAKRAAALRRKLAASANSLFGG